MKKTYKYPVWSEPLPRVVNGIEAWMTQKEADKLKELSKDKEYCEIGSWEGYSAWEVSKVAKHVITMDLCKNDVLIDVVNKNKNLDFYYGDSHVLKTIFKDESFDIFLIDGYHYYDIVLKDYKDYIPKVKIGGIICFHDYHVRDGVTKVINLLRKQTNLKELGICDSLIWFKKIK